MAIKKPTTKSASVKKPATKKGVAKPATTSIVAARKATSTAKTSAKQPILVGILTGSPNDLPTVVKVRDTLTELGIASEIIVASAHRTPDKVIAYIDRAHREGVQVLIGCAGMAAHLAGVIAGHTRLPVIGLPLSGGIVSGLDALLSTVQMPPGVPVATVAVDGSKNAAMLAARILALKFPAINEALEKAALKERARYEQTADEALAKLVRS
ncbi:MAG: 5-(carboxyamino)imidazole ribonucleotide mutase [Gammaproteobacteria bacterium]|nr:5-(carboxyamino)imidazole ribonucleotide mutase [Gammaproteobacteria bacterium]MBU1733346.1 5-(carboxyamino)imidazole ribonucleotide mutase [Gammaproteobacteria bacterium]MBU1892394.1 5-(carboxyamino)imidazole ribonucleotide mutase [Gammaproteobacteria bacterium]